MNKPTKLIIRDDSTISTMTPTMVGLIITLLILFIACTLLIVALFLLRRIRSSRKHQDCPMHDTEQSMPQSPNRRYLSMPAASSQRRVQSIHVYHEKQNLIANSSSPPPSPIPEIRVTFPQEVDETGKRKSGRVVIVRVGDAGVGLEPLVEMAAPPYQEDASDRFQSLDLDRIGGLKEKEYGA